MAYYYNLSRPFVLGSGILFNGALKEKKIRSAVLLKGGGAIIFFLAELFLITRLYKIRSTFGALGLMNDFGRFRATYFESGIRFESYVPFIFYKGFKIVFSLFVAHFSAFYIGCLLCVYVHVCVGSHIHMTTHINSHAHMCACMHATIHVDTQIQSHLHTDTYTCAYKCVCGRVYVGVCACVSACVCLGVRVFVCAHT